MIPSLDAASGSLGHCRPIRRRVPNLAGPKPRRVILGVPLELVVVHDDRRHRVLQQQPHHDAAIGLGPTPWCPARASVVLGHERRVDLGDGDANLSKLEYP
eukprot:scaffold6339_cov112-Isochrysis_galbana.AAC.3